MTFTVKFLDSGRSPQCPPNPAYPNGIDVDARTAEERGKLHPHCCYGVPYPAPRCGAYVVECEQCEARMAVTVAGRSDDPRSVTMSCKGKN